MRRHVTMKVAVVAAGLVVALTSVVLSSQPATAGRSGPAKLQVTELHPEGFTLTWKASRNATGYSVLVVPVEPFGSSVQLTTQDATAVVENLVFAVTYEVSVAAIVDGQAGAASTITVTTPVPDDYQGPSAPGNLRVERDSLGQFELLRWDASTGGRGTITYEVHLDSPGFLSSAVWVRTTGLTADASDLPVCDGCEYDPSQVIILWVTAHDLRNSSPPGDRLELNCCPF